MADLESLFKNKSKAEAYKKLNSDVGPNKELQALTAALDMAHQAASFIDQLYLGVEQHAEKARLQLM